MARRWGGRLRLRGGERMDHWSSGWCYLLTWSKGGEHWFFGDVFGAGRVLDGTNESRSEDRQRGAGCGVGLMNPLDKSR